MNDVGGFQRRMLLRLAAWSVASVAGGSALMLWGGPLARGAGLPAAAWAWRRRA